MIDKQLNYDDHIGAGHTRYWTGGLSLNLLSLEFYIFFNIDLEQA